MSIGVANVILEDLVAQSGTEYEQVRGNPDEILMPCPFCVGESDQAGKRHVFGLHLVSGKAHCFRCGWKSASVVYTARELCRVWDVDFNWRLRLSATESQEMAFQAKVEA